MGKLNSQQPLVSVIVPCYNHENYVGQTIESIVHQTYNNIELIVIDDGSKDGSAEKLEKLQEKYSFNLILRENHGLIYTINEALTKYVNGKYVSIIASDDIMTTDRIKLQVEFFEQNPDCHLSYGDHIEIDLNGKELEKVTCNPPKKDYFGNLLLSNYISAPTTMIRTSIFKDVGLFSAEYKIEDWYMWLQINKLYPYNGYISKPLAFYRVHPGNTHKDLELMHSETLKILSLHKESKYYEQALAIAKIKFIVKTFLFSFTKGFKTLFKTLSFNLIFYFLKSLLNRDGPFLRGKIKYWNFTK